MIAEPIVLDGSGIRRRSPLGFDSRHEFRDMSLGTQPIECSCIIDSNDASRNRPIHDSDDLVRCRVSGTKGSVNVDPKHILYTVVTSTSGLGDIVA